MIIFSTRKWEEKKVFAYGSVQRAEPPRPRVEVSRGGGSRGAEVVLLEVRQPNLAAVPHQGPEEAHVRRHSAVC